MKDLLRDPRVMRLLIANTCSAIGTGITVFAVPWLLVHQPGGNEAYRWATVGTTLALFVVAPYYGAWVDAHSRKTALLLSDIWGLLATAVLTGIGLALGGFGQATLVVTYFAGMMYYTLHYPAKFALIQQMFARSQYQSLIGLIEIQGQTAMMIAGGVAGLLVDRVPLWTLLLANSATYVASFLVLRTLPYAASHLTAPTAPGASAATPAPGRSVWRGVADGWRWLRARPRLAVFFTCSLMPFVVLMAANYLFPIYVAQTLRVSAVYFAGGEITFALGAILAGFLLPRLIGEHSAAATIPGTMLFFLAGLLLLIVLRLPFIYLVAGALIGFGNAGCRVARSALLLHVVPNEVMGRVGGFYQVFDRILRTALVMSLGIIDTQGPPAGFLLLTIVFLLAFAGVLRTRDTVRPPARA
jgi:MFS family permease